MNKVYCQDCEFYSLLYGETSMVFICKAEKIVKDIWGNKKGTPCVVKNQDCDCKDFRARD